MGREQGATTGRRQQIYCTSLPLLSTILQVLVAAVNPRILHCRCFHKSVALQQRICSTESAALQSTATFNRECTALPCYEAALLSTARRPLELPMTTEQCAPIIQSAVGRHTWRTIQKEADVVLVGCRRRCRCTTKSKCQSHARHRQRRQQRTRPTLL